MARKTGSHSDITGPKVRRAAQRLFARHGYAAVSMRRIAAEVGVQAGALYLYTPDKQTLLFDLMRDLRAMGEGNALAQRLRRPTRRDVLLRAAALYAENHPDPQDVTRIRATFDLVFLTGWAPDASQQKPLRPGSARMPLAEALASTRKPE